MVNKKIKTEEIVNKAPLYDASGKKDGIIDLDKKVFTGDYSTAVLHQAVRMYSANKRVGLASTKVRSEVRGGGKKPWRQKGTGRARVGSSRNPLWKGGGISFGPHPKSFKYQLPKAIKKKALLHSLNSKLKDGEFTVIKDISIAEPKTKMMQKLLSDLNLKGTTLLAVLGQDKNIILATRNLKGVTLTHVSNLNAFDVLRHSNFLVTEKGLKILSERLKG